MKIAGQNLGLRASKAVILDRLEARGGPLSLTIQALPLGFEELVNGRLPAPRPPVIFMRKEDGKAARKPDGTPIREEDFRDVNFQKKVTRVAVLSSVAFFYEGLKADKSVSWGTPEPKGDEENWEEFYSAIHSELVAANFTLGEFKKIADEIQVLSGVKEGEIASAREHFLPVKPVHPTAPDSK